MCKKLLSLCLFLLPLLSQAQDVVDAPQKQPRPRRTWTRGIMLDFGTAGSVLSTDRLDLWATAHGSTKVQYPLQLAGLLILQVNKTDVGVQVTGNKQTILSNFLVGRQVYQRGHYTSLLELSGANLRMDVDNVVPPGFSPVDATSGATNYLKGSAFLLGLTTRHVISTFTKRGYDMAHVGVFATFNYRPGNIRWKYGYDEKVYDDSDGSSHTQFHGQAVHGVPDYGRFMFTVGITIGLGGAMTSSYPSLAGR